MDGSGTTILRPSSITSSLHHYTVSFSTIIDQSINHQSIMFEKTLQDIVKGIRASKRDTALYISQCIAEIKTEINSSDMFVKANALQKLTFLHMMGYSMNWASFATIEVMSAPRFAHKRIGYLAASQGFTQDTDVILLTTNLLKKELRGFLGGAGGAGSSSSSSSSSAAAAAAAAYYESGLAVNCVSNIVTAELAQDLLPELTNLTSHPQPYIRKKAILCLYKLFVKYPQGLRLTFGKIQQCLNDSHPAVVSCAVNVITELSDKNPKNYLHLAPSFFDLLTTSSNNWMLIKVVKLLGSLVPEEPRLARKLLEPLAAIVKNTPAKSLLFESAHAITRCLPYCRKSDGTMPSNVPDIVALCAHTFKEFVEEKDQNLKYLGLVGFGSLVLSYPKVLSTPNYRPLILTCLSDDDVTIRSRALGLLPSMATRKNIMELVSQLLQHIDLASGVYKLELVSTVVEMCSGEKYALLQDFEWYLDILFQLGHRRGLDAHAELLRSQVSDIALRVLPVRAYAVKRSMEILLEGENDNNSGMRMGRTMDGSGSVNSVLSTTTTNNNILDYDNGRGKHIMPEILPAISWIVGEYSDLLPEAMSIDPEAVYIFNDDSEGPYHSVVQAITAPSNSNNLPTTTQSVYLQASLKMLAAASANAHVSDAELEACVDTIAYNLVVYMESTDVEVRERAVTLHGLLVALNLIHSSSFGTTPPTLLPLDDDEDDDDDDDDDDNNNNTGKVVEGNLLDMPGSSLPRAKATTSKNNNLTKSNGLEGLLMSSVGTSTITVASRCRSSSATLNYLLKPSPMKPTGAKAQRKKQQSPIGVTDMDLDAPVNISIFSSWIDEEKAQRGSSRLTMESVTFTQQRPLPMGELLPKNIGADAVSTTDKSSSIAMGRNNHDFGAGGGARNMGGSTFQSSSSSNPSAPIARSNMGGNRPQTVNDPFYLNSNPGMFDADDSVTTNPTVPNKFGAIQLGDDDEAEEADERKKKKKKKDKTRKELMVHTPPDTIDSIGQAFGNTVAIYDSDDDEDGDNHGRAHVSRRQHGRKGVPGKEFSSLAQVDLTMPLRDDEVMPERKHRVVPERSTEAVGTVRRPEEHSESRPKKSKKESKRSKKASKHESAQVKASVVPSVGDLLDLGGFSSAPLVPPHSGTMSYSQSGGVMQSQASAISNAFDDFLGMTAPSPTLAPVPALGGGSHMFGSPSLTMPSTGLINQPPTSGKVGKRPYLRAAIKSTPGNVSSAVDWSKVRLSYRVYRVNGPTGIAASLALRVDNTIETRSLLGVVLQIGSYGDIPIGDVAPNSSVESSKVGPFPYIAPDEPLDLKGTLITTDGRVTFKLSLPASMYLSPTEGLTMDHVASELASPQWSSHSAKITLTAGIPLGKIKSIIGNFLHMSEIEPNIDPMHGTFAGQSTATGTPVRVLVKIKTDAVKVDVKSGNVNFGKAIVSELKKLVL
jgi:AP-3 complex subunit delta-1